MSPCDTTGCRKASFALCAYPVTRRGRRTTCNRRVCMSCAGRAGHGRHHCPPHARLHAEAQAKAEAERREADWWREFLAGFTPVKDEDPAYRSACECKTTEDVIVEADGYTWTNPKLDAVEGCRGCEFERLQNKPCPIHRSAP